MTWNPWRRIREMEAALANANDIIEQQVVLRRDLFVAVAKATRERNAALDKLARMSSGLQRHNAKRKLDAATRRMAEQTAKARKTLELRGEA